MEGLYAFTDAHPPKPVASASNVVESSELAVSTPVEQVAKEAAEEAKSEESPRAPIDQEIDLGDGKDDNVESDLPDPQD